MPFSCSVCDRELRDDERECPVCGAPSTRVMHALEHGDDEWESLADRGTGPLQGDDEDDAGEAAVQPAPDPEWEALVAGLEDSHEQGRPLYARERTVGAWRRLRDRFGR